MEGGFFPQEEKKEEKSLPFLTKKGLNSFIYHPQKFIEAKTFKKKERLKSEKLISLLFEKGNSISQFPFKILWLTIGLPSVYPVQVCISVPKKAFPLSVDRNRIKRMIRESYRQNKCIIYRYLQDKNTYLLLSIIFTGKKVPSFEEVDQTMKAGIERLLKDYEKNAANPC